MTQKTIAQILEDIRQFRAERERARAELSAVENDLGMAENALLEAMNKAGVDQVRGSGLSVSIISSQVAKVVDWDALENYVYENGALHLLERRVHTKAWREECEELGGNVPGTEPYTRQRLNVNTVD